MRGQNILTRRALAYIGRGEKQGRKFIGRRHYKATFSEFAQTVVDDEKKIHDELMDIYNFVKDSGSTGYTLRKALEGFLTEIASLRAVSN